jgi:hypothetical protein
MGNHLIGFSLILALVVGFGERASADPFDRPATSYGSAVNDALEQAGSELRFRLDRCGVVTPSACHYSSPRVAIVVLGGEEPRHIGRIIIAADILKDHPAIPPDVVVLDALITLTATMIIFDPDLAADRRNGMVASLAQSVHDAGHGEASGIRADYGIELRETAGALLVITAVPKAKL